MTTFSTSALLGGKMPARFGRHPATKGPSIPARVAAMDPGVGKVAQKVWLPAVIASALHRYLPSDSFRNWLERKTLTHLGRTQPYTLADLREPYKSELPKLGLEEVTIPTQDGQQLYGWYFAPQPGKPTLILAKGNFGSLLQMTNRIKYFAERGYGFVGFEYRGLSRSTGGFSEDGVYEDLRAASRFAATKGIASHDQVLWGASLGTIVATKVALEAPYRGLILEAPLKSIASVVQNTMDKAGFPSWVKTDTRRLESRLNLMPDIAKVTAPVLVVSGDSDFLAPKGEVQQIFEAAQAPKRLQWVQGGGHFLAGNQIDQVCKGIEVFLNAADSLKQAAPLKELAATATKK